MPTLADQTCLSFAHPIVGEELLLATASVGESDSVKLASMLDGEAEARHGQAHAPRALVPKVSVVIIFHNELLSMLARSVISVLNKTPQRYLGEIILIDDHSDITEEMDAANGNLLQSEDSSEFARNNLKLGAPLLRFVAAFGQHLDNFRATCRELSDSFQTTFG